jgi:hypothetical protein
LVLIHQKAAVLPDCGAWWSGFSSRVALLQEGLQSRRCDFGACAAFYSPAPCVFSASEPELPLCNNVFFSPKEEVFLPCGRGPTARQNPVSEAARTHARTRTHALTHARAHSKQKTVTFFGEPKISVFFFLPGFSTELSDTFLIYWRKLTAAAHAASISLDAGVSEEAGSFANTRAASARTMAQRGSFSVERSVENPTESESEFHSV